MTNNGKAILITVLGVGAACVVVVGFMIAVIAISLIAVAGEEDNDNKTPVTTDGKRRKQTGVEPNKSKANRDEELNTSSGSLAPEMVGRWHRRQGGGEVDFTGKSRYRSYRRYTYEFAADGAIEYSMDRETLTIMQCEIKERRSASGRASTEGAGLVIRFDETDSAESNSCEGGETVERTLPAETVNLNWRIKTEDGATRLCFDEPDGEACYDKAE